MDILGIPTVLVPPDPGNVSAFGLLTVDVKNDYVQTQVALDAALDVDALRAAYDGLTGRARDALLREGFAEDDHVFQRTADLRYFGQAFEVRVPVPDGDLDRRALDGVAAAFHAEHRGLYGYDFAGDPSQQVEWVNLRVSGIGPITRPERGRLAPAPPGGATGASDEASLLASPTRPVCFDAEQGYVDTPVRWRPDLAPGTTLDGPVVIEEYGSTVPVHPGFSATVDDFGNLLVRRTGSTEEAGA
jgi:N-methylhydantoinase A